MIDKMNMTIEEIISSERKNRKSNELKLIRRMAKAGEVAGRIRHNLLRYYDLNDGYVAQSIEEIQKIIDDINNPNKD